VVRCAIPILKPQEESQVHLCMFNCEYLTHGSTFLAHLVSLLVKVDSMIPSPSCYLDTIHHPPPQPAATEEGAPHYLLVSH